MCGCGGLPAPPTLAMALPGGEALACADHPLLLHQGPPAEVHAGPAGTGGQLLLGMPAVQQCQWGTRSPVADADGPGRVAGLATNNAPFPLQSLIPPATLLERHHICWQGRHQPGPCHWHPPHSTHGPPPAFSRTEGTALPAVEKKERVALGWDPATLQGPKPPRGWLRSPLAPQGVGLCSQQGLMAQ